MIDLNDMLVFVGLVVAVAGAWIAAGWGGIALVCGACAIFAGTVRQMPRKG